MAAAVLAALLPASAGADTVPPSVTAEELGNAEHGAELWVYECSACHQMGEGAEHAIGPNLTRVFGRRAAAADDFPYSDSLARQGRDGLVWDFRTLDAYVANPRTLVSGTNMGYPGLDSPEDRADLLAYIRLFSDSPQNIPEAPPTARRVYPELSPEVLAIQGDIEYGEYLASECTTCHQRSGANEGIPSITRWPEEYFVLAMHAYREGLRPHPVMQMVTRRLNDEEIASLAAYFATVDE